MASASQYYEWLSNNQDKKGSDIYTRALEYYKTERRKELNQKNEEKPVYSMDDKAGSLLNAAGAAIEPNLQLLSGAPASIIGGLSGLGTIIGNSLGGGFGNPADNVRTVQEALTYEPKTKGGKLGSVPMNWAFDQLDKGAEYVGDSVLGVTGSPALASAAKTTMMAIPTAFGMKGAKKAMPPEAVPSKAASAVASPVTIPLNAVKGTVEFIYNTIANRMPGGAKRATIASIDKMLGDKFPEVIKLLRNAKEGQTAGQAATKADVMEFSALSEFARSLDPTGYEKIFIKQRESNLNNMRNGFAETPSVLAKKKDALSKASREKYAQFENDIIDPRSNVDKLNQAERKSVSLAAKAREGKVNALQDADRLDTLAAQQNNLSIGGEKLKQPLRDLSSRKYTRTGENPADVFPRPPYFRGEVRAPARYTPQRDVQNKAKIAADEVRSIAKKRAEQEKTYSEIAKIYENNKRGESSTSLESFLSRNSIKNGIKKANEILSESNQKLPDDISKWTGKDYQLIKRTVAEDMQMKLDAAKAKGDSGMIKTLADAITKTKQEFTDFLRSKNKKFAEAEDFYAEGIKPINQMKVGQRIIEKIGSDARVPHNRAAFRAEMERLENEGKLKDLTNEQIKKIEDISEYMANEDLLKYQSKLGSSSLNKDIGAIYEDLPKVNWLDRKVQVVNAILRKIEGKNTAKTNKMLSELDKNPNKMADAMEAAERKKDIIEAIKKRKNEYTVTGMIGGQESSASNRKRNR